MVKKQYLKNKAACKVTFTLPKAAVSETSEVRILGDFNDWKWEDGVIMKSLKAEYKATIELPVGQTFQFRYQTVQGAWENDWNADAYVPSPFYGIDNSVVTIEKIAATKGNGTPETDTTAKTTTAPKAKKTTAKTKKTTADNLKTIEGIGPKIAELLNAKGVKTFDDLAKAKVSFLKEVLAEAGSRYKMHDPTTWPEQAKLAAAGETKKLETLQAKLKGGKRK